MPTPAPSPAPIWSPASEAEYHVLIACAFSYEAHASELSKLGRTPVLKARMNADLHMGRRLEEHRQGQPVRHLRRAGHREHPVQDNADAKASRIQVRVNGLDVYHPNTGGFRSAGPGGIACWFIDTDYNEESFVVRYAYFLGTNDPYKASRTKSTATPWETLRSDTSRPLDRPLRAQRRQGHQPPRRRSNEGLPRLSHAVRQYN